MFAVGRRRCQRSTRTARIAQGTFLVNDGQHVAPVGRLQLDNRSRWRRGAGLGDKGRRVAGTIGDSPHVRCDIGSGDLGGEAGQPLSPLLVGL